MSAKVEIVDKPIEFTESELATLSQLAKPNAVHSLYGGATKRRRALSGNVGGQEREQTVLTPRWLIDGLCEAAGEHVRLDPCTTNENPVGATQFFTEHDNGLEHEWTSPHRGVVYCNPPYGDLEAWLCKAAEEYERGANIYLLGPLRPHRAWFCQYLSGIRLAMLSPVKFVGHKTGFPAPLFIACFGLPVPDLRDEKGRRMVTGVTTIHVDGGAQ